MKISELVAILQRHMATHGDVQVLATWEGVFHEIERQDFAFHDEINRNEFANWNRVLVIDVD